MIRQNYINLAFALIILAIVALACGGLQTADANKLIAEANVIIEEAQDLSSKTADRNEQLLSVNIKTPAQLQAYKAKMKDEARDIVADFEKSAAQAKAAGEKFAAAAKLNIAEEFKKYLTLKAQELEKRAESISVLKGNAQAFLDYDDFSVLSKRFDENDSKARKLNDEAVELEEKADKIKADNKEIFKS